MFFATRILRRLKATVERTSIGQKNHLADNQTTYYKTTYVEATNYGTPSRRAIAMTHFGRSLFFLVAFLTVSPVFASVAYLCTSNDAVLGTFEHEASCEGCFDRKATFQAALDTINPMLVQKICGSLNITLSVYGVIDFDDAEIVKVSKLYADQGSVSHLKIESNGGFLEPAMDVGNFLFDNRIEAIISGDCFSACGILIAGAVRRFYVEGTLIGIHRLSVGMLPSSVAASADEMNSYFSASYLYLTRYLERFGIGQPLVDAMKSTPNARVRRLTPVELSNFGLGFDNVSFRDLASYKVSSKCGKEAGTKYNEIANMLARCYEPGSLIQCTAEEAARAARELTLAEKQCLQ